jgi:uncharacterized protein YjdB
METDRARSLFAGGRRALPVPVLVSLTAVAFAGCESSQGAFGAPQNGGLVLSEEILTLRPGETARLAILDRIDGGDLGTLEIWSSGNPWVAVVDEEGLVYASKPGVTTVYASDGEVEGSTRIKVQKSPKTLRVEPEEVRLSGAGAGYQLAAYVENAAGKLSSANKARWKSLDPDVAEVDGEGIVRGASAGVARVVAEQRGSADTALIAVGDAVQIDHVEVDPTSVLVTTGDSLELRATAYDDAGQKIVGLDFAWASSDDAVATVSGKGFVRAAAAGEAALVAAPIDPREGQPFEGLSASASLTVRDPNRTVIVSPDPAKLDWPGAETQLVATVLDENGSRVDGVSVEWSSLNPEVAEVSATGWLTSKKAGTALITAAIAFGATDTIQAQVASGEQNTGSGDGSSAWIASDFEKYSSTEALRLANDYEVLGGSNQFIEFSNPPPGLTRSVRMEWGPHDTGCYDTSRGRGVRFPERVYEVWVQVQIRYDEGFTTHNASCPPNDHKVLFLGTSDGNYRWEVKIGMGSKETKNYVAGVAGSLHGYLKDQGIDSQFGNVNADLWDGQWHTIRWHVRSPTSDGASDGRYRLWVDGSLKTDFTYASENLANPGSRIPMTGLLLGRNKNDGPPNTAMSMYFGGSKVWRTNPGW